LANKFLSKLIFASGSFSPWYFGPILHYDKNSLDLIKNADLIIGAGMPTKMFYDAYVFAKKYKKRLILHPSYHNVSYYNHSIFFQRTLSFANVIIYQTPLEKNDLNKNYKLDQKKLKQLTYCPYTEKDWQKALKQAQLKEKVIKNKIKKGLPITIGYVGQITQRKNLQFFANLIKTNLENFEENKIKVNFFSLELVLILLHRWNRYLLNIVIW
jgi:glycosyltransferase involved in cell wall biosynthesis